MVPERLKILKEIKNINKLILEERQKLPSPTKYELLQTYKEYIRIYQGYLERIIA